MEMIYLKTLVTKMSMSGNGGLLEDKMLCLPSGKY